ncbi:DUF7662 domain-containing protein [Deinococcus roseus]|uniref:DUF7662 domain-containing protein n=1 Tax=Deinococcus roseus TaxID=392414 RepID=A0ABQ2D752_9DEIO|nr:hypothetical protein [Deinococcus roseus]GGJ47777.1 hypothetical protein GCM10008938_37200 [Deinococcus roseus]
MKDPKHLQLGPIAQHHLEQLQMLTGSSQSAIVEQALAFYHLSFNPLAMKSLQLDEAPLVEKGPRSKYDPIGEHLRNLTATRTTLSFEQIEDLIHRKLPDSARTHRAWWSNSGQPHSRIWVDAGWEVDTVNFTQETVTFQRKPQEENP